MGFFIFFLIPDQRLIKSDNHFDTKTLKRETRESEDNLLERDVEEHPLTIVCDRIDRLPYRVQRSIKIKLLRIVDEGVGDDVSSADDIDMDDTDEFCTTMWNRFDEVPYEDQDDVRLELIEIVEESNRYIETALMGDEDRLAFENAEYTGYRFVRGDRKVGESGFTDLESDDGDIGDEAEPEGDTSWSPDEGMNQFQTFNKKKGYVRHTKKRNNKRKQIKKPRKRPPKKNKRNRKKKRPRNPKHKNRKGKKRH